MRNWPDMTRWVLLVNMRPSRTLISRVDNLNSHPNANWGMPSLLGRLRQVCGGAEVWYATQISRTQPRNSYIFPSIVLDIEPTNPDAKMRLAEVYEILDQPRMALTLVNEGEV